MKKTKVGKEEGKKKHRRRHTLRGKAITEYQRQFQEISKEEN